jgi:hypothetical protein
MKLHGAGGVPVGTVDGLEDRRIKLKKVDGGEGSKGRDDDRALHLRDAQRT